MERIYLIALESKIGKIILNVLRHLNDFCDSVAQYYKEISAVGFL